MLALEEKNNLSNELASTKKRLEEIGSQKVDIVHLYLQHNLRSTTLFIFVATVYANIK